MQNQAKWDQDYLDLAMYWARKKSKDPSTQVGAVVVDAWNNVAALCWNGFPKGVLDTPERATPFRALARDIPPEAIASIDEGRERTHAAWMASIERFQERHPPEKGRTYRLGPDRTDVAARVALYAGWGDGLSRVALGPDVPGIETEGFVTLSQDGGV